jgi:hypothetical protein
MDGTTTAFGWCKEHQENVPGQLIPKNNLKGDPKRWKDGVENDTKKDENC